MIQMRGKLQRKLTGTFGVLHNNRTSTLMCKKDRDGPLCDSSLLVPFIVAISLGMYVRLLFARCFSGLACGYFHVCIRPFGEA